VHTEVGHSCIGSKVNGRLVTLNYTLRSGDTCEVFTAKSDDAGPSRDWLNFVASPRARNKIRQWFSRERRDEMIEQGREELVSELRREGLPGHGIWDSHAVLAEIEQGGHVDLDSLFAAIGENHVGARGVAQRLSRSMRQGDKGESVAEEFRIDRPRRDTSTGPAIHVEGLDDVLVRLSSCCTPVPGDEIMGFVTKGRGVSVHRVDCANAAALAQDHSSRVIDVDWSRAHAGSTFRASVEVVALDRSRLLRDVANALSDHHVNIVACSTQTGSDRVAKMRFEFELGDPNHLDAVLRTMKNIDAVYDAYRVLPGKATLNDGAGEGFDE
jgi:GTP pyrophosphokinase